MKIIITDCEYEGVEDERRIITDAGIEFEACQLKEEAELIEKLKEADGVITQYAKITENVLNSLEKCRVIVRYGIGVDNIDVEAATRRGIYVCNVPDYGIDEVSNHAIALMFSLIRKITYLSGKVKNGEWDYTAAIPITRLAGRTMGLVGFGRIPRMVADKMKGFGVKLLVYDPYVTEEMTQGYDVDLVDFETLCKESDIISVHCPLNKETYHMFDEKTFEMLKPTAYLVNTARGPIVSEAALYQALKGGRLAGAALDVFEQEPTAKDNPLLSMDCVLATPHFAWYSDQSIEALKKGAAKEAVNVVKGNPPLHNLNKI